MHHLHGELQGRRRNSRAQVRLQALFSLSVSQRLALAEARVPSVQEACGQLEAVEEA